MTKRCSRCILPDTYPGIAFDDEGVCSYCRAHRPRWKPHGEDKLREKADALRGKHGRYDCIAAVSGGRDSAYMLWYAVRKLGLRTLACFVDNGYVPAQTRTNIENTVKALGVDLVVKRHENVRACFPHSMRAWIRRPDPGMIGLLCGGCNYGLRYHLLETAREQRVPVMLFGVGEPEPDTSFAEKLLMSNPDSRMSKGRLLAGFASRIAANPRYLSNRRAVGLYAREFAFRWSKGLRKLLTRKIAYPAYRTLEPFYFIEWNEREITETIEGELGWRKPAHAGSTWRSDCEIATFKNYLYRRTLGFSKIEELLSGMIRTGMTTREAALERVGRDSAISEDFVRELLAGAGIRFEDFDRALDRAAARRAARPGS